MSSSTGRLDATKHHRIVVEEILPKSGLPNSHAQAQPKATVMAATIVERQPSLSMGVMLDELMAFPSYTKWPDSAHLEKNPTPRAEVDS